MFHLTKPESLHIGYVASYISSSSPMALVVKHSSIKELLSPILWMITPDLTCNTIWPEHAQTPQVQNASRIDSMEQISETHRCLGKLAVYP